MLGLPIAATVKRVVSTKILFRGKHWHPNKKSGINVEKVVKQSTLYKRGEWDPTPKLDDPPFLDAPEPKGLVGKLYFFLERTDPWQTSKFPWSWTTRSDNIKRYPATALVGGKDTRGLVWKTFDAFIRYVLGLLGGLATLHYIYKAYRSWGEWETTEGEVLQSVVIPGPTNNMKFKLLYTYEVDSQKYIGNSLRFTTILYFPIESFAGYWFSKKPKLQPDDLAQGKKLKVYYDPTNPSKACILPGFTFVRTLVMLLIPTTCFFSRPSIFYHGIAVFLRNMILVRSIKRMP